MNYDDLFSKNFPAPVAMHPGLRTETKYIFSVTYADRDTMALDGLAGAVRDALGHEGLSLGMYPPPKGHEGMRELIAENLKEKRGFDASIDDIFLTSGAGGAIKCIVDAFIDPGDIVLVEEFTYLGTLSMLLGRQAEVIHIPTDEHGMDGDALESKVKELLSQGRRPKMIVTISVYQNPLGVTLSEERRRRMLEVSHRYGIPIMENESYADFRIDGPPLPPSLAGMDDQGSVIYVSAYTKLLGCGLRLGYAVAPGPVTEALATLRFGGSPSHLAALAVNSYLRSHGDGHIREVAASLGTKRDTMLAALGEHFPASCSWSRPQGGMMIWVRLPEGADTWAALDKAVEADVKYNPGPLFRANRDCKNYLRLTYSHNNLEEIREGVGILAGVFEREGLFNPDA